MRTKSMYLKMILFIGLTVFGTTIPLAIMVIPIDLLVLLAVILVGSIPAIRYLLCLKPTEVLHGR